MKGMLFDGLPADVGENFVGLLRALYEALQAYLVIPMTNFLEEKALWVLNDKKSAEKPETGFKSWTERVKSLLELAWWPLLFFSTASQMEKSEEDKDAGPIGMLEGIGMRKLLAPRSCQMATENANLFKVSSLEFRQKSSFQDLDDRTGSMSDIVARRILQLVALLHNGKDNRFRVLKCINFFDDVPWRRLESCSSCQISYQQYHQAP
ncbi:uncharacterized protein RCO7_02693 [Rhynchosporium graminicola]|uniref:Uncharacterized protein n=1 Tax=Rhynchosporium graminicola TaxID=2792576 RepID=A0A1E1KFW8_9HELO|nr:uncharacterized protein RCO7_02693 [Rhynchosporium commune]